MLMVMILPALIGFISISCLIVTIIFYFRAVCYTKEVDKQHEVYNPARTLASLVVEAGATTLMVLLYPFGIFASRRPAKGATHPHWIILVHGYGTNRSAFFILKMRLKRMGFGQFCWRGLGY